MIMIRMRRRLIIVIVLGIAAIFTCDTGKEYEIILENHGYAGAPYTCYAELTVGGKTVTAGQGTTVMVDSFPSGEYTWKLYVYDSPWKLMEGERHPVARSNDKANGSNENPPPIIDIARDSGTVRVPQHTRMVINSDNTYSWQ